MFPPCAFAAIHAQFTKLALLELCVHGPDGCEAGEVGWDLSSFTFPHLRDLIVTNNLVSRLVLDDAHYPQLRSLHVEATAQLDLLNELQLQLSCLLVLKLEGGSLESASALAACLSHTACPRLRHFSAVGTFLRDSIPLFGSDPDSRCELVLDMPWLEHFELQDVGVKRVELRAPG